MLSSLSREELAVSVAKVRFPSCCFPLFEMLTVHIYVARDRTKLGASQLGLACHQRLEKGSNPTENNYVYKADGGA